MQKTIYIHQVKDLDAMIRRILQSIKNKAVLLLYGELGSGKTAFTKRFGKIIGVKEKITSPTFVIKKMYKIKNKPYQMAHFDLYRMNNLDELNEIGFYEVIIGNNIALIEWPDKIKNLDSKIKKHFSQVKIIKISFFHTDDQYKRKIVIDE